MIILETERLKIRQLMLNDSPFILTLLNTPGWLAYIGDRNVHTLAQADTYLQNGPLASYAANGFGLWAVQLKIGETPIGICGLIRRDTLDDPDIGYAFLPEYTGQGYAREAAAATLHFAQNTLGLNPILAITTPTNTASIHLLTTIGFSFVKSINDPSGREPLCLFSTTQVAPVKYARRASFAVSQALLLRHNHLFTNYTQQSDGCSPLLDAFQHPADDVGAGHEIEGSGQVAVVSCQFCFSRQYRASNSALSRSAFSFSTSSRSLSISSLDFSNS